MKNIIIIIIISFLFINCQKSKWGEILYAHSKTNIRKLKSTSSSIVKTLNTNDKVKVIDSNDKWWWLVFDVDEIRKSKRYAIGYVYKPLLFIKPIANKDVKKPSRKIEPKTPQLDYTIVDKKDLSFSIVVRTQYKVQLDRGLNKQELKSISKEIVENLIIKEPQNAVTIFYYLPNTNTKGGYTAGMVDWAPFGDWGKSDAVLKGNYTKHDYNIIVGGVMGEIVEPKNPTISDKKRQDIFYNLVKLQDTGYDNKRAYTKIAKRYNVDEKLVEDIVMEGLTKGWRMP